MPRVPWGDEDQHPDGPPYPDEALTTCARALVARPGPAGLIEYAGLVAKTEPARHALLLGHTLADLVTGPRFAPEAREQIMGELAATLAEIIPATLDRPAVAKALHLAGEAAGLSRDQTEHIIVAKGVADAGITAEIGPGHPEVQAGVRKAQVSQAVRQVMAADSAKGLHPPEPVSVRDLVAEPPDPRPPLIAGGLLRCGTVVLLTASRKVGKTITAHNVIMALADGGLFLGQYQADMPEGNVGIIDVELPRDTAREWLAAMPIRHPERIVYWNLRGRAATFGILDPLVLAWWASRLRREDIRVLVVDCLSPIVQALGLDENTEAGKVIEALKALQAEAALDAVILVHHHGWTEERGRGDSKIEGGVDDLWRLSLQDRNDPESLREFSASGRHAGVGRVVLRFDPGTRCLIADQDTEPVRRGGRPARTEEATETLILAAMAVIRQAHGANPPGDDVVAETVRSWSRANPGQPDIPRTVIRAARRRMRDAARTPETPGT